MTAIHILSFGVKSSAAAKKQLHAECSYHVWGDLFLLHDLQPTVRLVVVLQSLAGEDK